jgi:hypothetical protein
VSDLRAIMALLFRVIIAIKALLIGSLNTVILTQPIVVGLYTNNNLEIKLTVIASGYFL